MKYAHEMLPFGTQATAALVEADEEHSSALRHLERVDAERLVGPGSRRVSRYPVCYVGVRCVSRTGA